MNPFSKALLTAIIIVFAIWLLFSHNESEPDNRLPRRQSSCLPNGRPLTKQVLPNGGDTNYRAKSPSPGCPMKPSPTCTGTRFCRLGDVSAIIKEQADPIYPDGYYKWRQFDCDKGWYNRLNESGSWQRAVSDYRRGSAKYIQGADYREKLEFDYICAKYAK